MNERSPGHDNGVREASSVAAKRGALFRYGLLFVCAFAFLFASCFRALIVYDEGIILTGAARVMQGALPHRDFYAIYGPLQFYAEALWFEIFGPSVLAERALDYAIKAAAVCVYYSAACEMMERRWAMAAAGATLLLLGAAGSPGYPIWLALLLMMIALRLVFAASALDGDRTRLFLSGLFVGFVALVRYDMAFLFFVVLSVAIIMFPVAPAGPAPGWRRGLGSALLFWTAVAVVFLPPAAAFVALGGLNDFLFQIVRFPMTVYPKVRALPFPLPWEQDGKAVQVYLPMAAFVVAGVGFVSRGTRLPLSTGGRRVAIVLMASVALFLKGLVRLSPLHLAPSIAFSLLVLGAVASPSVAFGRGDRKRSPALAWVVAALMLVASVGNGVTCWHFLRENALSALLGKMLRHNEEDRFVANGSCFSEEAPRARCFLLQDGGGDAIRYIQDHTKPDERIFVGAGRHDKIFINDVAFYFLADRAPVTKWYHFDPGLQTSEPIQQAIISELSSDKTSYVVLMDEFDDVMEPNDSALSSHVLALDSYIRDHYAKVARFGFYTIYSRQ